jgi:hypothetical protein
VSRQHGRRKGPTPKRRWQPMAESRAVDPSFYEHNPGASMWKNDRYTAILYPPDGGNGITWLSIRRNDRRAIHDWRDLQQLKNDIVGPEREAFELYPDEGRLVDSANQYHLWVLPAGKRLPVGWTQRIVTDSAGHIEVDGRRLNDDEIAASLRAIGGTQDQLDRSVQRPRI